jgi:hypothetical protein
MTDSGRVLTLGDFTRVAKQDGAVVQEGETVLLMHQRQLNEGRNV